MAPLRVSITKSEWLPDDLTAFVPLRLWKSPFITTWDGSQNQNHPTDSADEGLKDLIKMAKHRWIIERDYEELKQELGLGHFEGRNWRGFHHHATLCIAAYGFLVAERNRFSPSARAGHLGLVAPKPAEDFRPRGSPRTPRAT